MVRIIGHFDGAEGSRAYGWIANLDAPEEVLTIEFFAVTALSSPGMPKAANSLRSKPRPAPQLTRSPD